MVNTGLHLINIHLIRKFSGIFQILVTMVMVVDTGR